MVKATSTENPDGTINLHIDPTDVLEAAENQLAIEKAFPFFMRDRNLIKRKEAWIADWKKTHGL